MVINLISYRSMITDIFIHNQTMSSTKPLLPSLAVLLQVTELHNTFPEPAVGSTNFITKSDTIQLPLISRNIAAKSTLPRLSIPPFLVDMIKKGDPISPISNRSSIELLTPATTPVSISQKASETTDISTKKIHFSSKSVKCTSVSSSNEKKRTFAFITHSPETYPKKEPKSDNEKLARRKRRKTSTHELNILQAQFEISSTLDKEIRLALATKCNMSEKAIQIWFQNKRQSLKKETLLNEDYTSDDKEIIPNSAYTEVCTTPTKSPKDSRNNSPIKSPLYPTKGPQALTFHLNGDSKILKAVKSGSNNRVNRLINNYNSELEKKPRSSQKSNAKPSKLAFKSTEKVLSRELNHNILHS